MFEINELLETIFVVSVITISIIISLRAGVALIKEEFFANKRNEEKS